jgi:hypothetical protein
MHGPGHQGDSEKYEFYGEGWDDESLQDVWQEWCHREFLDDAIGGVDLVKELPEEERQKQIKKYRGEVQWAIEMLTRLGADKE